MSYNKRAAAGVTVRLNGQALEALNDMIIPQPKNNLKSGVYEIVNTLNGHRYIGSSSNIKKRIKAHKTFLDKNKHENPHLQRAWNKYGGLVFVFNVILFCDREMNYCYEQICFDSMQHHYNIATDAKSAGRGRSPSVETRRKLSEATKGRIFTEEEKRNISNGMLGHLMSDETKQKIRDKAILRNKSEEYRKKIGQSHVGKQYWLGRHHSEETKRKLSEIHIGKTHTNETKRKIGKANKGNQYRRGIPHTEEVKNRISQSLLGNTHTLGLKHSEESKRKMSASQKNKKPDSIETRQRKSEAKKRYWEEKRNVNSQLS